MRGSSCSSTAAVVAYDPTHHRRAGLNYITVATGRDFADVTATSGVFTGSATGKLHWSKQAARARRGHRGCRVTTVASQPDVFAYDPGEFWDEMFAGAGQVRPYYAPLARALSTLSPADVERRQRAADLSFQARGITFAVNQEHEGIEKIMPFDLVPRIITAEEWRKIERGLEQRVRALNLFLLDIYQTGRILRQGIVPADLVLGSRGYRREVRGMNVPLGVYTHVVGSDLVRDGSGEFYVLEDNLRTPSGVSYVVENRRVLKRVWSSIFHGYDVRPVEGYAQDLLDVLRAVAPGDSEDEPTVVLLTPGVYNSAYFEHAFLAKGMGVQMVEGSDLFVDDGMVYHAHHARPAARPRHLPPRRRRLPRSAGVSVRTRSWGCPACWPATAWVGSVWPTRRVPASPTTRPSMPTCRASSATTWTRIPILPTIHTYLPSEPDELQYVLEHIGELVVKSVNESGGYGMLVGPHSTQAERDEYRERVRANPRGYIAQPTLALSRHPCWVDDHFEGRHVDLRPFVLFGRGRQSLARAA